MIKYFCVPYEKPYPQIFKIKPDQQHLAYSNNRGCGPIFGFGDLHLLHSNRCYHEHQCFDNELHGNQLCGGNNYNPENIIYYFNIKEMNTFTIKTN